MRDLQAPANVCNALFITRSWSRGKRFESARRLSQSGLPKLNTRGFQKPPIHRCELSDTTELLAEGCIHLLNVFLPI
jgi:hypothetical protein